MSSKHTKTLKYSKRILKILKYSNSCVNSKINRCQHLFETILLLHQIFITTQREIQKKEIIIYQKSTKNLLKDQLKYVEPNCGTNSQLDY